jgi:hypothetical protein
MGGEDDGGGPEDELEGCYFERMFLTVLENTREPSRCYLGLVVALARDDGEMHTSRAFPLAEGAQGP